jgi:NADH dehydrogenase
VRLDMRVEQEVAAAVAGADAVVNLVGAFTGDLDAAGRAVARWRGRRGAGLCPDFGNRGRCRIARGLCGPRLPGRPPRQPSRRGDRAAFGPVRARRCLSGLFAKVIAQFPLVPVFAPHARLQPLRR